MQMSKFPSSKLQEPTSSSAFESKLVFFSQIKLAHSDEYFSNDLKPFILFLLQETDRHNCVKASEMNMKTIQVREYIIIFTGLILEN